jgi:Zn ribbon nucleic-acid-binding protein
MYKKNSWEETEADREICLNCGVHVQKVNTDIKIM